LLEQALDSRPDLRVPLLQLLRRARETAPADFLATLHRDDPAGMRVLGLVVAGGYYLSDDVRRRLGYPGQMRHSYDPDAPPDCLEDGTLQRVIDRGPIWRCPDDTAPL
jgi:hypothetical protein